MPFESRLVFRPEFLTTPTCRIGERLGGYIFQRLAIQAGPDAAGGKTEVEIGDQLRSGLAIALLLPRGVGPTSWPAEKHVQIRRRFLLLGQSLETMQVWDARMALAALRTLPELEKTPVSLLGSGSMSVVALFSGIFEDGVTALELENLPSTFARDRFISECSALLRPAADHGPGAPTFASDPRAQGLLTGNGP